MAAPTAVFTVIPLADVDPDSPITVDLMDGLRLNDQNLFAQLVGEPVTAPPFSPEKTGHDHDGTNSKNVSGASWVFLERKIVTGSAITSFDFAVTLNGDADDIYWAVGRAKNADASFAQSIELRLNGAITGVTPAVVPSLPTSGFGYFHHVLWADSTILRAATGARLTINSSEAVAVSGVVTVAVASSVANITSLGYQMTGSLKMDVGSDFTLYRLKQV